MILIPAALIAGLATSAALGADLPSDIWSGRHGGNPTIGISRTGGVSVVLPGALIGDDPAASVKAFLERWAPAMCSDLFDFQSPHKQLHVTLYIQEPEIDLPFFHFYRVSPSGAAVVFDYQPARIVKCVEIGSPTS